MIPAEGEGSPSRVWPGGALDIRRTSKRQPPEQRANRWGGGGDGRGGCTLQLEPGVGVRSGTAGEGVCLGGREGGGTEGGNEGEGGVSHGRAPSRARLESPWL